MALSMVKLKNRSSTLSDLYEMLELDGDPNHPGINKVTEHLTSLPEDILALSVALRELRQARPYSYHFTLDSKIVLDALRSDHKEKANEIRDYYSKKIMLWKLKGVNLSSYRTDLNTFIHNSSREYPKSHMGIAYWLPEFHEYDIQLDEIRMSSRPLDVEKVSHIPVAIAENLTPIKKIKRNKKNIKMVQYWFRNDREVAEVINLETNNPLIHMWDKLFDAAVINKDTINIYGVRDTRKRQEDFSYATINSGWTIVD
jgi:hypothetical protein